MNLAENLARDYPQVVPEAFTNDSKERWATDFKILLQRRDVTMPRDRELVGQIHAIKRRVLPSGKVSFDAERTAKGHADKFWAVANELEMPIHVHIGLTPPTHQTKRVAAKKGGAPQLVMFATTMSRMPTLFAELIFNEVFERFPGLTVVGGEVDAG